MSATELKQQVTDFIKENPSMLVRSMAFSLKATELDITDALPEGLSLKAPAEDFVGIWEEVCTWEKVLFMAETPGMILEVAGPLPKGKFGHGMYNLNDKSFALGGHILAGNIKAVRLVSKPAFGKESHYLSFFSAEGLCCFSLYLGRDASGHIIETVKEAYLKLWERYRHAQND